MLEEIIYKSGVTNIDQAQNGYDGYQLVLKKNYDIILCDLNMPVMNGYQCAKKIIARYAPQQSLFIAAEKEKQCPLLIAYSALITDDIEKKCKEHGFDLCLQSPITIQMINEKVIPLMLERTGSKKQKIQHHYTLPEKESSSLMSS
jgi:CheY-like chemotaxis protein